jgi:hypothetical protein
MKGTPNKATQARRQLLAEAIITSDLTPKQLEELSPLAVMQSIMQFHFGAGDYDRALAAAKEAAPFCHPKLAQSDVTVRHSLGTMSDSDLAAEIAAIHAMQAQVEAARVLSAPMLIEAEGTPESAEVEVLAAAPAP